MKEDSEINDSKYFPSLHVPYVYSKPERRKAAIFQTS
jgi:hypothetical protein